MDASDARQQSHTRQQPRLLALLRDEGPMSRVALGERLELPRTKLSGGLTRLVDAGLVQIGGPAASRGGRRSMLVHLADDLRFLAADVGATSVNVAVTDGRCEVLASQSEDCDVRQGPKPVLSRVVDLANLVLEKTPGRLMGAGIGLPGPVSFRDGMPVAPPIMPGWDRYPVREELAGRWGCPVTVDNDVNVMALGERHAGVARSLDGFKVGPRVSAEFTSESGERQTANLLQGANKLDALWNHDDDQGVGVLAAIESADRDEFIMAGGAGSKDMMDRIKSDSSVIKATVLYSPAMASSAISLARLLGQNKGMADLAEHEIPASITAYSAVVTKENVDQYLDIGFAS